jgi:hypothetical protein
VSSPTGPRIEVPEALVSSHRTYFGETGSAWIEALPDLAAGLLDRWQLQPDGTPTCGAWALVLPVVRADATPAVLKLQPVTVHTVGESDALRAWNGNGAVRLLDHDPESGSMLLERPDAARSLTVGMVTLNITGCADPFTTMSYNSGSFIIATNVGALSGTASGPVTFATRPGGSIAVLFQLTLRVVTGTGSFAGTTGNLQFVTLYSAFAPPRSSGPSPFRSRHPNGLLRIRGLSQSCCPGARPSESTHRFRTIADEEHADADRMVDGLRARELDDLLTSPE